MVENLQALFQSVDAAFGWKLRKVLQCEPQIMLLGTATSRFAALDDVTQPFFEFFHIVALEPLGTEACRHLWEMVGGQPVTAGEVRPLEILTGGNPRLLVMVATFAGHRSFHRLMEAPVALVDECTEYFRGHLDVLAKTERRVYLAVIDLWQPSTAAEVAARARMDIRIVSTMLGRLRKRRAIGIEDSGPKRLYAASESLYCLYYKLRRERDQAGIVRQLLRFMTAFYVPREAAESLYEFRQGAASTPAFHPLLAEALAESSQSDGAQDHHLAVAMDLLRSLVAGFVPDDRAMLQASLTHVLELMALGAAPGDVARVLSSNPQAAAALRPLVVALRQQAGATVRAPAEVMEVAADIRNVIESRTATVAAV